MNAILISKTVQFIAQRIKIGSRLAVTLAFAAISILMLGLTSCITVQSMGNDAGGYQQQQMQRARLTAGQFVSNGCFGNQPVRPTAGCIRIKWEDAFGPQGPWINDFGNGRAQVQHIPIGQMILFDQSTKWAWKEDCGNRVMLVVPPQQQARPQVMPQRPYRQPWYSGWQFQPGYRNNCPPPWTMGQQYGQRMNYMPYPQNYGCFQQPQFFNLGGGSRHHQGGGHCR